MPGKPVAPITLREGDEAPAFTASVSGGGTISLSDFRGRYVVLYFYPKDDTPGCTKEACEFRDLHSDFARRKIEVLGVSADPIKAHDKFTIKHRLPFRLVSDPDHRILGAYGVWGEKLFMGRRYQGIHRVTFLIGPDGTILKIWPQVSAAGHAAEVLAAIP